MTTGRHAAVLFAVWLLAGASEVRGQGFGVMGGAHVNPDQLQGAVLYEFAPLGDRLRLRPSGGVGVGNDATLVTGNFDVIYQFKPRRRSPWMPYAGGGPAINHYRLELYNETEMGVTAVAGLAHASRWFSELRVGFFDSPAVTAAAGYWFGRKPETRDSRRGR